MLLFQSLDTGTILPRLRISLFQGRGILSCHQLSYISADRGEGEYTSEQHHSVGHSLSSSGGDRHRRLVLFYKQF
jgi:hypothetical protein